MNKVILMGRLTKNPEIKYAGKDNDMAVARYTLAVNRRYKRDGEQEADFISCVTFGKSADKPGPCQAPRPAAHPAHRHHA